jgi:Transglutaminase-like superfamily
MFGIVLVISAALAQELKPQSTNPGIAQLAQSIAGSAGSGEEKTRRLINWINTNFKWSATDYQKRTPEEIIARRAGNCFELANVLEVLLQAAGIRSRWVAEINIHPRSEQRQATAENKVAEFGKKMSVFGLMHNDHRWLEVYDEKSKSWIPADPAVGVVGTNEWIAARAAFQDRTKPVVPAVAKIVEDMIVPVAVVALESKHGKPVEDRSEFYLVDGLNKFYGQQLTKLPSWDEWKTLDAQLSPLAAAAFTGETNLHEHAKLIEQIARAYEKLRAEAVQNKILSKESS